MLLRIRREAAAFARHLGILVGVLLLHLSTFSDLKAQPLQWVKAAPSGPDETTNSTTFVDVPDMHLPIVLSDRSRLAITFRAEPRAANGKRMFIRALVDNQSANPTDVHFDRDGLTGVRSFTFITDQLSAGPHTVRIQCSIDPGGTAAVGDRTLVVYKAREADGYIFLSAAPSGPDIVTNTPSLSIIPGVFGQITGDFEARITFSAEVDTSHDARVFLRPQIGDSDPSGTEARPSDVVFARGEYSGT